MSKIARTAGKVLLGIVAAALSFFIVTFTIYFFNLDMKATAMLEPFFEKWYEKLERRQYI